MSVYNLISSPSGFEALREAVISRREFLKFLGAGVTVFAMSLVGANLLFEKKRGNSAAAASLGTWDSPMEQPGQTTTVHAALLDGGKVLWIQGSGNHALYKNGPFKHGIWNPDNTFGSTFTLAEDLFCCGMNTLANGNVLLAGGTLKYDSDSPNGKFLGGKFTYEADFHTGEIGSRSEMAHGRWYPTQVTLPNGKVFVTQGYDEFGAYNKLVEIYDPDPKTWTIKLDPNSTLTWCAGAGEEEYFLDAGKHCYGPGTSPFLTTYPRMHLMPNGLIATVGQSAQDRLYDPDTGGWVWTGSTITRGYGTSCLCPLRNSTTEKGKILVCGGTSQPTAEAYATAEIVQTNGVSLIRRPIGSMAYSRKHGNPVLLPTGKILIFGGTRYMNKLDTARLKPEEFDPQTEKWNSDGILPASTIRRGYHSVALLLHDGRVWTAGTTVAQTALEPNIEIYNPWYVSEPRPVISGEVITGSYGTVMTIPTPDAANITKVSLVRTSSTTHHYNTDQRLIWLQILARTGSTITVQGPINANLAPPGKYLVHVLNNKGVPSIGKYVAIPGVGAGNSYVSIYKVSGNNNYNKLHASGLKRAGELITASSVLVDKSVRKVSMILKKSGNPTGTISVVVRTGFLDKVALTFGKIDASTLSDSDQTFTLEAPSLHTFASNDKVSIEWGGTGSSTDQVWVKRYYSSDSSSGFDGSNTKNFTYKTGYASVSGADLAGEWFSSK